MKHLVVVDDCSDQIELMIMALRTLGLSRQVAAFSSGEDCIAAAEAGNLSPVLVLLDVNMPGLDGPATASRLRKRYGSGVPIVMMSTSDLREDVRRGLDAGADSYVMKPHAGRSWLDVLDAVTRYWLANDVRATNLR